MSHKTKQNKIPSELDRLQGKRMAEFRKQKRLSQTQCAMKAHYSLRQWQRIEKGEWPARPRDREEAERRIAEVLEVKIEELRGQSNSEASLDQDAGVLDLKTLPVPLVEGRIFGDTGQFLFSDLHLGATLIDVDRKFLKPSHENAYCIMRLSGNSMEPLLPNGSLLLVNTNRRDGKDLDSRIVAVQIDQEKALVKVLSHDQQGRPILRSINQERFPDIVIEHEPLQLAAVEAFSYREGPWQPCDQPLFRLLRLNTLGITRTDAEQTLSAMTKMQKVAEQLLTLLGEEKETVSAFFEKVGLIHAKKNNVLSSEV